MPLLQQICQTLDSIAINRGSSSIFTRGQFHTLQYVAMNYPWMISIWVNCTDLTAISLGNMVCFTEIIPFYGLNSGWWIMMDYDHLPRYTLAIHELPMNYPWMELGMNDKHGSTKRTIFSGLPWSDDLRRPGCSLLAQTPPERLFSLRRSLALFGDVSKGWPWSHWYTQCYQDLEWPIQRTYIYIYIHIHPYMYIYIYIYQYGNGSIRFG